MASPGTSDFWKRLDDLFNQAVDMDPSTRERFLDQACGADSHLRAEVESLLRSADTSDGLEHLVHDAAQDFLEGKSALHAGSRIGGYEIISLLGAGGMGRVYLAQDQRLRRKVAIKTLNPEALYDRESLRRFEQEALAASALNHPNIRTIFEVGESAGLQFIASEYVDGPTLREKLSAGTLSLEESLDIAIQVAAGLTVAHAAGIIHRDIKPENILVRKDGIAKIVDFGIAKLTAEGSDLSTQVKTATRPGVVLGTARYMSPEQAQGVSVDARTDIFSLGKVLHEMVAVKPRLKGADRQEIISELLKNDPVPRELTAIIGKATQRDRERRYSSAQQLLDALQAFKQEHQFRARLHDSMPGTLPAATSPRAMDLRLRMMVAVVLLALAATVAYFIWTGLSMRP